MKTLKFTLIAVLVACTLASLATTDDLKSKKPYKKVVNLTLKKASTNPGLVAAIYQQVTKNDVINCTGQYFIAQVTFEGNIYRITGTRDQWMRFLRIKGGLPVNHPKGIRK